MINVNSIIKMDWGRIQALTEAQVTALEQTAEYLHTEVVQAQVIPFDDPRVEEYKVYGKRGQFAKNGREYKGKIRSVPCVEDISKRSTFVIIPGANLVRQHWFQARHMQDVYIFTQNIILIKVKTLMLKANGWKIGFREE